MARSITAGMVPRSGSPMLSSRTSSPRARAAAARECVTQASAPSPFTRSTSWENLMIRQLAFIPHACQFSRQHEGHFNCLLLSGRIARGQRHQDGVRHPLACTRPSRIADSPPATGEGSGRISARLTPFQRRGLHIPRDSATPIPGRPLAQAGRAHIHQTVDTLVLRMTRYAQEAAPHAHRIAETARGGHLLDAGVAMRRARAQSW